MRLWSLHPRYLDSKGLVALWREGLLAQKVLAGKTKGYKSHPQLDRFKKCPFPRAAIEKYLLEVLKEADRRGYSFSRDKIQGTGSRTGRIAVTGGQLRYEREHLRKKLKQRDPERLSLLPKTGKVQPHPSFRVISGPVEKWEKTGG